MRKVIFCLFVSLLLSISAVRAEDRALLVGVDVYENPNLSRTDGATDDAKAMQKLLIEKFGFAPNSIKLLLDSQATAQNIVHNFETWLINGTRPGDRVFFIYAGHGFQAPDDNGDEEDGQDEVITPYDITFSTQGGKLVLDNEKTFVRDDKFNDFIAQLSGRRAVLLFDSCHSGTISRGVSSDGKKLPSRYLKLKQMRNNSVADVYSSVPSKNQPRDLVSVTEKSLDGNVNGVVVLSAASPYQQAFPIVTNANVTRGAFTYIFENLLMRDASQNLTNLDIAFKREMKNFADKGFIGQSTNGEFQVPQMDIVSEVNIADKPLFAASSNAPTANMEAAVETAMFNPLSTMTVKLNLDKPRYKIGETIRYGVDVGEDSYLYILVFSTQNKAFCIFPTTTGGDLNNFVNKGRQQFPREDYTTEATEPLGKDVWVALVSKKKLNLGEKEEYTWDEMFQRIGLAELQKAIADKITKNRGAGNKKNFALTAADWQADSVVVETVAR